MIDRFLYRLGLVRRSYFDELREAAENMQTEYIAYRKHIYNWYAKIDRAENEKPPQPPVLKLIQGGKK